MRYVDGFYSGGILICLLLMQSLAFATPPKPFSVGIEFPSQGVAIQQETNIKIVISNAPAWIKGDIILITKPFPYVVPDSNADNVKLTSHISLDVGESGKILTLPLTVLDLGEYDVRVEVSLDTKRGKIGRAKTFSILAEDGVVWYGLDSVDNAVRSKVQSLIDSGNIPANKFNDTVDKIKRERTIKSRENALKTSIRRKPRALKLKAGETKIFKGTWEGPGSGNTGTNGQFWMHGVKITIEDKDQDSKGKPLSEPFTGYLDKGQFSFKVPRDNYSFKVTVESVFPGIQSSGAIDTSGSGIGNFQVVQQTASGNTYKQSVEDTLTYTFSQANVGREDSSVWAAFHGMAEMVLQAKKQLRVDKNGRFKILFYANGSHYDLNSKNISILNDDRYDWDVVAHEFGHAIGDEHNVEDKSIPGEEHDGSNQYDFKKCTDNNGNPRTCITLNHKANATGLAFSEGFGTWFGTTLLEHSGYKGLFTNVGDKTYDDTEDSTLSKNLENNTVSSYFGEDTENALYALFWDFYDAPNEANSRATCTACKDNLNLGLKGVWDLMDNGNLSNISEFWHTTLSKAFGATMNDFLKTGEGALTGKKVALRKALDAAYTFAEFGIAPHLKEPAPQTQLKLLEKKGPVFKWKQEKTGTLALNEFILAFYSQDLNTLVFKKEKVGTDNNGVFEYELTENDLQAIKAEVDKLSVVPASLLAVIIAKDTTTPETGPYLSNPVELLLQPFYRAVVMVVDSSGSNSNTDPNNLRITAAQKTVQNLISQTEATAQKKAPDVAGAIDFDSSVTELSGLDDPDVVVPLLTKIDSSGGTNIAAGIDAAINMINSTSASGTTISGSFGDKAAIVVFTDGANNDGPIPVIQAIVRAGTNGIRVHYGFLQPFSFTRSNQTVPSDAPEGYIPRTITPKNGLPATVEEAVLATGGVYGVIGDAASQVAFVQQIEEQGLANSDRTASGGGLVVGQVTTSDTLNDPTVNRAFSFNGQQNEQTQILINTNGNFHPFLTIYGEDGKIIAILKTPEKINTKIICYYLIYFYTKHTASH